MKGRKVLIVEDERRIARFLQMELEHEGCITALEDNGSHACERLAQEEYDIVLLDVMLPGMDGFSRLPQGAGVFPGADYYADCPG